MSGAITKPLRQVANVRELLVNEQAKNQLAAVAASHMKPERMMRLMANALRTTPQLAECEPLSLLGAMMTCASLGLEPNTVLGHAYLIPFKNRRKNITEVQLVIGYKGMIDLARRSGHIVSMHADVVYDGDDFDFHYGTDQFLRHKPAGARGTPTHAYCYVKLTDGEAFIVYPYAQVLAIRDASQGYRTAVKYGKQDSPWIAHEHQMARKTMVRAIFNELPVSIEKLSDALEIDDQRADFGAFAMDPTAGAAGVSDDGEVLDGEATPAEDDPAAEPAPEKETPSRQAPKSSGRSSEPYAKQGGKPAEAEKSAEPKTTAAEADPSDDMAALTRQIVGAYEKAKTEDDVDEVVGIYEPDFELIRQESQGSYDEIMEAEAEARKRVSGEG